MIQLVEKVGAQKWTIIAEYLPSRIGKHCRERWHNHLNPKIKKCAWSLEEEQILFLLHRRLDNKWAEIAKVLEGRTDNTIKNHWNSSMKKKLVDMDRLLEDFLARTIAKSGHSTVSTLELKRMRQTAENQYLQSFIDLVEQQNRKYFWERAVSLMRRMDQDQFSRASFNLLLLSTPYLSKSLIEDYVN